MAHSSGDNGESFYPYRVQHGQDHTESNPFNQSDNSHKRAHHARDIYGNTFYHKNQESASHDDTATHAESRSVNKGWRRVVFLWLPLIFLTGLVIFIFTFNQLVRMGGTVPVIVSEGPTEIPSPSVSPTPSLTPSPTPTPTPPLKQVSFADGMLMDAYNQTTGATSFKVAFSSDVVTTTDNAADGVTAVIRSVARGYLVGSSVDSTIQTELRIWFADNPDLFVSYEQILTDGELFFRTNQNELGWYRRDESDYNRLYENQPIDGSAYSYNLFDSLYTESRALLRAIDTGSIERGNELEIDNRAFVPFGFVLSVSDYIEALKRDPTDKEYLAEDAERILRDASITGTLFVSVDTGYIERIELRVDNLTQISREESDALLGITTRHDLTAVGLLSEFNDELRIVAPPDEDVLR